MKKRTRRYLRKWKLKRVLDDVYYMASDIMLNQLKLQQLKASGFNESLQNELEAEIDKQQKKLFEYVGN